MSDTFQNSFGDSFIPPGKILLTAINAPSNGALYIGVDTSATVTITINTGDIILAEGRKIIIKDETGNANVANITIDTQGAETIDTGGSAIINTSFGSLTLIARGGNLFLV